MLSIFLGKYIYFNEGKLNSLVFGLIDFQEVPGTNNKIICPFIFRSKNFLEWENQINIDGKPCMCREQVISISQKKPLLISFNPVFPHFT